MINTPNLSDIKTGDLFVTSGYGGRFPRGYPVGVVTSIHKEANSEFLDVNLSVSAHLDQTERVLLVWPSQLKLQDQVQQLLGQPLEAR